MALFEVWSSKDGSQIEMVRPGKRVVSDPGDYILRTFEASTVFEAFRTHWQLMGWGEWKPDPDWADKPVPED
jgi:hypothetical protein